MEASEVPPAQSMMIARAGLSPYSYEDWITALSETSMTPCGCFVQAVRVVPVETGEDGRADPFAEDPEFGVTRLERRVILDAKSVTWAGPKFDVLMDGRTLHSVFMSPASILWLHVVEPRGGGLFRYLLSTVFVCPEWPVDTMRIGGPFRVKVIEHRVRRPVVYG